MNLSLIGKNAVVCGSTQGIGWAAACELAEMGASVTLIARNEISLESCIARLNTNAGQTHHYIVADFAFPPEVKLRINEFISNVHPFHILVNNSGGPAGGSVLEAKPEEFLNTFNQHLICNHHMVQACVSGMKTAGYGRIINVISTSVKQPIPGLGVSNTTRAAVAGWSKTLAGELGKFNITVNNVLPGATLTGRLTGLLSKKSDSTGKSMDVLMEEMAAEVPAKRIGQPEEIAALIAFLASPAASYINGTSIPVDGGRTACF
jgi:3-oxoacyl-[acyl-carrier protein] reductase